MIKLNYLEKLLDGVGVEWKTLGEVAKIQRGASPRPIAKFITDKEDGVPWIKIGDTSPNSKYVNKTEQRITPEGAMKSRILKKGDFIMSNSMSFGRPYILNIDGAIHDGWASISDFGNKLNSDYLYHYLSSDLVRSYWVSKINSGSVSNLNSDIIKSLEIPIPPLKVQKEIVRILDDFTKLTAELTAELKAELTARKKQYTYYLDKLMTFDEGEVEWKTLGEVGEFTRGKRFVKKDMLSEGFPCIHYGELYTHYNIWAEKAKSFISYDLASKLRVAEHGDVVIVAAGETIEDIGKGTAWLGNTGVVIHDACFSYRSSLNPKYVSYFLRTKQFHDQIKKYISSGKISAINADGLSRAKIPIPIPEKQALIISILDKLDALKSSIIEYLPREIELRQKQYEYYRNMLLSFSKSEVEA
ncbi:restriction endonuclease subunit S [Bacillus pumilus]|uniref:restriction endonuclease subunit S n=1 Tax=Bacillus pumilus TaxID=1408 RepID=UPI00241722EB|nr:restriction endonuclease subunit S [Bacillus pumilus]WFO48197.1 restriction endonuclease subunit S [Bacillus pumilus]